jgi:hypothetical protein
MDIDATLRAISALTRVILLALCTGAPIDSDDIDTLSELIDLACGWLSRGGYMPAGTAEVMGRAMTALTTYRTLRRPVTV